jgi:endoglycosylceramidase
MEKIAAEGLKFVDGEGRVRLFNGFNIDDKLLNCERFRYELDEEFFRKYRAYGLNFIRLAVTWQNLEPQPEKYNESYLRSIDGIFSLAEKYGVYILLDVHQDLYSGYDGEGVGDGAPMWATLTDGYKSKKPLFVWAEGYIFGKWVHRAFDHFWNNDPVFGMGLQDRYARLWQMLASRYCDSPALFGFDLMNEPFPGSDAKKMMLRLVRSVLAAVLFSRKIKRGRILKSLITRDMAGLLDSVGGNAVRDIMKHIDSLSAEFDLKKYSPFLNKITAAIREITKNGFIMIEQAYLCNGGVKQSVPPITVNSEREKLQCFGPHAYDMTVDTPLYKYANADRVKAFFSEMRRTQLRLDVPVVVGEWGGCSDNKDTSWFPHALELLDFFDEQHWGQAYWDYHGDDLDSPLMGLLCRPHPVAVAGEIVRYGYDREKEIFTLRFTSDSPGESIIYLHKKFEMSGGVDCETLEQYDSGAALVKIRTQAGEHTVEAHFTD